MENLYLVYILKRHYLGKNITNQDLDDIRAYIVFDYAIASILNEKVKILSGPLKDSEIVRDIYYHDEDYFVVIKNKLINYPIDEALKLLNRKRSKKLEQVSENYYMVMYGKFMKVLNPRVISIIKEEIFKNIKRKPEKIVSFTEVKASKTYIKSKKA